jgi:hypothetical protein
LANKKTTTRTRAGGSWEAAIYTLLSRVLKEKIKKTESRKNSLFLLITIIFTIKSCLLGLLSIEVAPRPIPSTL